MYLTEILARCSNIERRVAAVYRALGEHFQNDGDTARLWRELALEEETHAEILGRELRAFDEQDETGPFLPEYTVRLEHADRLLVELESRANDVRTFDEALALAVAVEQTELEDLYDDLLAQGHPAFRLISERLESVLYAPPAGRAGALPRTSQLVQAKNTPRGNAKQSGR